MAAAEYGTPTNAMEAKVLNTVELLESIISHLPCNDVIRVQRVSKSWKAAVDGSVMLQKALCFSRHGSSCLSRSSRNNEERLNASARRSLQEYLVVLPTATSAHGFYIESQTENYYVLNPLFSNLFERAHPTLQLLKYKTNDIKHFTTDDSRHAMYASQPPARVIRVKRREFIPENLDDGPFGGYFWREKRECRNDSGITFVDLVQHLEKIMTEDFARSLPVEVQLQAVSKSVSSGLR
ncbi:hypothetical protein LTR37_000992 [Vermiconidia calcicola]|uniref:Uncharacterized protein n=1 Tax=Vermiconidia calcicola TaxID=1690605 RepID=A0ACC3NWH3_9PEZI|nr:hypothetical protein LTR37_000992 [Vermiconidia calcicola]